MPYGDPPIGRITSPARRSSEQAAYRYLDILTGAACVALVLSNILAAKLVSLLGLTVNGATAIYPLCFLIADVVTEVYGYSRARRIIWIAFAIQIVALACILWVLRLPAAIPPQAAPFQAALDLSIWIVLGSLVGYAAGDFLNAVVMSRLKVLTQRRFLFSRTWASTIVGQAVDTVLFVLIAFGVGSHATGHPLPAHVLWSLVWGVYVLKVGVEVVLTPVVYLVVGWLKRREGSDALDVGVNYSPVVVG